MQALKIFGVDLNSLKPNLGKSRRFRAGIFPHPTKLNADPERNQQNDVEFWRNFFSVRYRIVPNDLPLTSLSVHGLTGWFSILEFMFDFKIDLDKLRL